MLSTQQICQLDQAPPQQDQCGHDCGSDEQTDEAPDLDPAEDARSTQRDRSLVAPPISTGRTKWSAAKVTIMPIANTTIAHPT